MSENLCNLIVAVFITYCTEVHCFLRGSFPSLSFIVLYCEPNLPSGLMPVSNPGPLLQHSLVRYQRATTVHSFAGWDVKLFICLYTNYDDVKSLDGHILQHQNTLIKAVVFTYLSDSLYTAKKILKYIFKNLQKSNEKIYLENIVFRSRLLLVKHCNFNWFLPVYISSELPQSSPDSPIYSNEGHFLPCTEGIAPARGKIPLHCKKIAKNPVIKIKLL